MIPRDYITEWRRLVGRACGYGANHQQVSSLTAMISLYTYTAV